VHLCSLLGGGKASLLGFGVAKDFALEHLHVGGEARDSGSAWIKGEMSQLGGLCGGSFGGRLGCRAGFAGWSHWCSTEGKKVTKKELF